jgi:long-chain-fatty-acid--[acyl-carrier-protein] ligase
MSIINLIKEVGLIIVFLIVRVLVSLRYRIRVKGLENIKEREGAIVLPNHPAEIDPVIVILALWKKLRPKPLVVDHFYYLKGFRFFMEWVGALPLPNLDTGANKWKAAQLKKLFARVVDELKKGHNFLIYPAGKLKVTGQEVIGGSSFVPNLLQEYPDAHVVLVRTSGLWGSRFSRAVTGKVPSFGGILWEGAKILLKNGVFFAPRREVLIEVEEAPASFPRQGSRMEINRYLEAWYNQKGPEPRILISDKFWKRSVPKVVRAEKDKREENFVVPREIEHEILAQVASLVHCAPEKIERTMHFSFDLGLDSLDVAQLYVFLDEKYGICNLPHGALQTVEDVMQAAVGYKSSREEQVVNKKEGIWPKEEIRSPPEEPWGSTIVEAFFHNCQRMGDGIACADHLTGALSYSRFKLAALVLSFQMRKIPGDYIGVLLPSSVAASLVILAIQLAKKVPVMLNWTTGTKAINHAVTSTALHAVISSRKFLNRLENGDLGSAEEKLLYLEEIRESISLKDKLKGWRLKFKKSRALLASLNLDDLSWQNTAVIIFTSGTEALPKGVPLTHQNILSDLRAAFQCVSFCGSDILYGVLPPFHSFGFSVTGLFPFLSGLKVFYGPDPTDSHGMASDIAHVKPTLFVCAPSFIRSMLRIADPSSLASLRLIVSGAEKAPEELFEMVHKIGPNTTLIEGYGITECSPIVTLCRLNESRQGVGRPLPGISLCTIDPTALKILPQGQEGEVCIAGPNVFSGYLGGKPDPFIELEGKKWYRSGDIGFINQEGSLILSGRLKRFVKIGGEMISLGGLEEELVKLAKIKHWITDVVEEPYFAISVKEKESDKPLIVLYTTFDVAKDEVNAALNESGFGRLARIGEVLRVDAIPMTGTGKIHHRLLDETFKHG